MVMFSIDYEAINVDCLKVKHTLPPLTERKFQQPGKEKNGCLKYLICKLIIHIMVSKLKT